MTDSILLIHGDAETLRTAGSHLEQLGYDVTRELNGDAGRLTAERLRPGVVILHHALAGGTGYPEVAAYRDRLAGVVLLVPGGEAAARAGLEAGAELTVEESASLPTLAAAASRAAERIRTRRASETLMRMGMARHGTAWLGSQAPMREIARQVEVLAQTDRTTVLLQGEQGVGKGYVARLLHDLSPRAAQPFFQARCAGMSPVQLDSLLFGHEKGAFPGATERRQGLLELGEGGSLYLQDVADLPPELQPKLLRYLEGRIFRRVGGTRDLQADTRMIVATDRNLPQEVEAERLREDLYFRLSGVTLTLPPLRERSAEDREALALRLHEELLREVPGGATTIHADVHERLQAYPWPGNIRELRQVLDRALLLARGQPMLQVEHLPGELRARPGPGDRRHTPMTLEEMEHQQIERALRYHAGNRTRASKELGISRATLINKIKLYGLTD
ncbi:MAG: sigma 54-interacting transcriptional regulator [Gemmatimonadales bacterium]|nr:sigma 54-interacting transcriptional regulator [Gemmatimonadales bacterium]